ncbi:MAG: cytochrome c [Sedimenticola sp.]
MKIRSLAYPLLLLMLFGAEAATGESTIPPERQAALRHLVKHDCGSCHGMRLEGGLGPSLQPDRINRFTTQQLATTILFGRPGTPMPPWRPFFSNAEAAWLATRLKKGELP